MIASDTSLGKLYNLMLYITTRAAAYIWAGVADLTAIYLIHIITTCQTNNSGGLRIESIRFLNRELDDEFTKWAEKIKTKLRILPSCLLLRRKETSVYILLLLLICWPLSIRRRAASRRTTLVPRAGLLTGLLSWEYRRRSVVVECWPEVYTDVQDVWGNFEVPIYKF